MTRPSSSSYGPSGWPSPVVQTLIGFFIASLPGNSPRHHATGVVDRLAGHVTGLVRQQEPDQAGAFVRRRSPAERHRLVSNTAQFANAGPADGGDLLQHRLLHGRI